MQIALRHEDDPQRLVALIQAEKQALQRDRLRAVRLALEGNEALAIAATLGRSRRFVQQWVYAYRDGGLDAVRPAAPGVRPPKLPREKQAAFKARLLGGATAADGGVCTLRGKDAQRILADEFGVQYTLQGVYDLMHRLNLSCLTPRPVHRKNDPAAMKAWVEHAPFLSRR